MEKVSHIARSLFPGVGEAVAARTVLRTELGEEWVDVAARVAKGNTSLCNAEADRIPMRTAIAKAALLMSGRHLQHGDAMQAERPMEVFTNCATAASSFILYLLLLSGSGVGRSYDSALHVVDWAKGLPTIESVIRADHPDVRSDYVRARTLDEARNFYSDRRVHVVSVGDSREGWAKAVERLEVMTWAGFYAQDVVLFDFSAVRERGAPIKGMQNRPASGPGPMMDALRHCATVRGSGMAPWKAALFIDHYLAECVVVGGARRAARMATKTWRDADIFDFIEIKSKHQLWSSNNSVTVDAEFWELVKSPLKGGLAGHAKAVFEAVCAHSYKDGTGEPGLINVDKLSANEEGMAELLVTGEYFGSDRYAPDLDTKTLLAQIGRKVMLMEHKFITNPCGEINLSVYGGYCVIADMVPYHTDSDEEFEETARLAVRALIRTNTMNSLYHREVARTNRIGVGLTGIFEYAWDKFKLGWRSLVGVSVEDVRALAKTAGIAELKEGGARERAAAFFLTLAKVKRAIDAEAVAYSAQLGMNAPHTTTTLKPAGTTSKLFGLTEAAHLPSMREYIRWVQFRSDMPQVAEYREKGYPVQELRRQRDTTIVGFPTQLTICQLGMGDELVTAAEATPEEQYRWLSLLEAFWIDGCTEEGEPLNAGTGGQVSYTLKYDPKTVSYDGFKRELLKWQPLIKCCSVMPSSDAAEILAAYEYLPEQQVSAEEYQAIVARIERSEIKEDIGVEHVDCANGACPVDFRAAA